MLYQHDEYVNYETMVHMLQKFKNQYPQFVHLFSLGKTAENRDLWCFCLSHPGNETPGRTSLHWDQKPCFLVDGNMHASEISGTQACLYTIDRLLFESQQPGEIQELLKRITVIFIPRACPDAAESYLKNSLEIRSSKRLWPDPPPPHQFKVQDLDGDGEINLIRVKSPAGVFKLSKQNSEILIQRAHDDFDPIGEYFNLYPEGKFEAQVSESAIIRQQNFSNQNGIDLNRQFPAEFRPEGQQMGAGPIPGFVEESKILIHFISSQTRIYGHLNLHTYGGLVLREPSCLPDEKLPEHDVVVLNRLAEKAAEVSGYTKVDTYHEFRYTDREVTTGTLSDWAYLHRGILSSVIEIWDVWKEAGLEVKEHVSRYFNPKESDLVKIFAWASEHLPKEKFFKSWEKIKHPDFGDAEVGGWKKERVFRNPPEKFLKSECEKVFNIILSQLKTTPIVVIERFAVNKIKDDQFLLTVVFQNQGFLSTNGSEQAIRVGAVQSPRIKIELTQSQKLVAGEFEQNINHLAGRSRLLPWHTPLGFVTRANTHESQVQWLIQGTGDVHLTADFQRGGVVRKNFELS